MVKREKAVTCKRHCFEKKSHFLLANDNPYQLQFRHHFTQERVVMSSDTYFLSEISLRSPSSVVAIEPPLGMEDYRRHLADIGFTEGETVTVLRSGLFANSPKVVRVGESYFALSQKEAACIRVRPITL